MADRNQRSLLPPLIVAALLVTAIYLACYAVLVRPQGIYIDDGQSGSGRWRHFYLCGDRFGRIFGPLEQLDRRIRPRVWEERSGIFMGRGPRQRSETYLPPVDSQDD